MLYGKVKTYYLVKLLFTISFIDSSDILKTSSYPPTRRILEVETSV